MNTLRVRLTLSHLLPLVIVLPLLGLILIYLIESQVLLKRAADSLKREATLLAGMMQQEPEFSVEWSQTWIENATANLAADMALLNATGEVVTANRATHPSIDSHQLDLLQSGTIITQIEYSLLIESNRLAVWVPLHDSAQDLLGTIQLTGHLETISTQFTQTRLLVFGAIVLSLFVAAILGLALSAQFKHRLDDVIHALQQTTEGSEISFAPTNAPKEFNTVLRAVQKLATDLEEAQQNRNKLLANLVHELGRPLGAMKSATNALVRGAYNEPELRQELLSGMNAQIDRLKSLLDNLAQLYSQSAGQMIIDRQPISLNNWLKSILTTWETAALAKGLAWNTTIAEDLPIIDIDPDRMAQVIGNLISNAIKYTPIDGTISISVEALPDAIQFQVEDTGIGVTADEQQRIFKPFYRGPDSSRFPQGMGLGLSIAQEIVNLHGGQIKLDQTPKQGSRFLIILPRA